MQLKQSQMKPVSKMSSFPAFKKSADELNDNADASEIEDKVENLHKSLRCLIAEIYETEEDEGNENEVLKKQVETLLRLCQSLAVQKGCQSLVHENLMLNEELRKLKEELGAQQQVEGQLLPLSDPYQLP